MHRKPLILLLFFIWIGKAFSAAPLFYQINLDKEIGSTTWLYVKNGLSEAKQKEASVVILRLNTYGGTLIHADSIRTALLNFPLPVYAFIDNNAASAGALIAIACDSIYMRPGASIGAATVVDQTGGALPDKYQSYMRAMIRATAESHGCDTLIGTSGDTIFHWHRNPLIAEAMVDPRVSVPGLIDSTRVLTFTTQEALKWNYCEGIAENTDELIRKQLDITDYTLDQYKPTFLDELKGFLTNGAVQAILIMIIIGGIYFELQTPGIGFAGIASLLAAILYFAPLYIEGLAAHWEILLFVMGCVLIAIELFFIPGFGIIGIGGLLITVTALSLALIGNDWFDFNAVSSEDVAASLLTSTIGLLLGFFLILYLSTRIGKPGFLRRVALTTAQETQHGYIAAQSQYEQLIGSAGISYTPLHPSGKIIINQRRYDAISAFGYIDKEIPVRVVRFENNQLYVIPITPESL